MKNKVFIDTNIFVYAYIVNDEIKHKISLTLLKTKCWVRYARWTNY
jgi:predicted nucleic acid-binding protein